MLVFLVVLFRASSVKLFTLHSPMCSISIGAALLFFFSMGAATRAAQSAASPPSDAATRANALYQQGLSVLKKGDLASARTAFEKVVRLAPQSPESHNSLGWVLLAQGEVDRAIGHFLSRKIYTVRYVSRKKPRGWRPTIPRPITRKDAYWIFRVR